MPDTQPNPAEPSPSAPAAAQPDPSPPDPAPIPEPAPMLDVHPAHHAANTWRDFFIHIATIVLGLLIAVGLEQTVEYIHHRREARDARENIQQEMRVNLNILQNNQRELADTEQQLAKNLDLLNSGAPDAQIIPQLGTIWSLTRRHDTAWNAARIDGSLALIPPSQIVHASYFYETTSDLGPVLFGYFTDMETARALVEHARATGKLTPAERQLLLSLTVSAMGRDRTISTIFDHQIRALQSGDLQ